MHTTSLSPKSSGFYFEVVELLSSYLCYLFNHLLSYCHQLENHHLFLTFACFSISGQPQPAIRLPVASLNVTVNLSKWKMKQLMFTLIIIAIASFPLATLATISPLESLLSAQIKAARCEARCKTEKDEEGEGRQAMQCREVCSLLLSSSSVSSSPLCSLPILCNAGCQTACNPPSPQPAAFLSPLALDSCSISWHLASSLPAVFLLGAKDRGGKWHLVATTSASSLPRLHLAPSYTQLHLLAVTSTGVVAGSELALENEEEYEEVDCKEEEPVVQSNAEPQQHITFNFDLKLRNVLSFALPGCLGLGLLFLLLLLLFRRLRKDQSSVADTLESQREERWGRRSPGLEVRDICNSLRTVPLLRPQIESSNQIQPKFSFAQNALLPRSSPADHFYEEVGNPYALTRISSFVRK